MRTPIPEIAIAAEYLNDAADAHLSGKGEEAARLLIRADMPELRDWTESLWGKVSPYRLLRVVEDAPNILSKELRVQVRMPVLAEKLRLLKRDCHRCRFCGVPVIRAEIRNLMHKQYPQALPWGRTNQSQHAAFQAMWAQFDHVLPHARGGSNDLENVVVACAPCNFGRMEFTIEELGLDDPRKRQPVRSGWDGLERLLK
ncbi:MAG: HNH endonuclease [Acidobacteriaceae bacterium]|nr:HNH endonuclease [Acidobacteriaceae bacterium]